MLWVCRAVPSGEGGAAYPPVIVEKSALFVSRSPFSLDHQQGAFLNLRLPPPSNFRLRTAMVCVCGLVSVSSCVGAGVGVVCLCDRLLSVCDV